MKREKGSATVLEMTFVLPIAIFVCLLLIYFTYGIFMYVYVNCLSNIALDKYEDNIGSGGQYWIITGKPISENELKKTEKDAKELIEGSCILPGTNADISYELEPGIPFGEFKLQIKYSYFGTQVFEVDAYRPVFCPTEYVLMSDFILNNEDVKEGLDRFKEVCNEFF